MTRTTWTTLVVVAVTTTVITTVMLAPPARAARGIPVQEKWTVDNFCFRRLNDTHQFGCSSSLSGDVGVVHIVENADDVSYVTRTGPTGAYVPLIEDTFMSVDLLDKFAAAPRRVHGVLVSRTGRAPTSFSPDDTCPNRYSSFYANSSVAAVGTCDWNSDPANQMSAALLRDYPFPIFYVRNQTIVGRVRRCFDTFNRNATTATMFERRRCAVRLYAPMNAAVDSRTCLRRTDLWAFISRPKQFCDPLSGHNVLGLLPAARPNNVGNTNEPLPANKTIVLAARMDTFTMFDGLAPGADSAVSGIVTTLAIVEALARHQTAHAVPLNKNILFALFNGEAFDYIGSSSFVFNLLKQKASYNLSMNNISCVLELSQLIPEEGRDQWFAHVDRQQYKDNNTKLVLDNILKQFPSDLVHLEVNGQLPPSSVHSFLKGNELLPSVVLTNHKGRYINRFYNSLFDEIPYRVSELSGLAKSLHKVATSTANALLTLAAAKNESLAKVVVSEELVAELLDCYLVNASCALFRSVVNQQTLPVLSDEPLSFYVSVTAASQLFRPATLLTYLSMAYFTGQEVKNVTDQKACLNLHHEYPNWQFNWMFGRNPTEQAPGVCIRHRAASPMAKSPAFEGADDTGMRYSTWTESVWTQPHLELFVQASGRCELVAVISGAIIFVLSTAISVMIYRQSGSIFEQASPVAC